MVDSTVYQLVDGWVVLSVSHWVAALADDSVAQSVDEKAVL